MGVAGCEEATEPCPASVADPLRSGGEKPPYPIQRVTLAASVPKGFVLGSASYLVETLVSQPDDVKWVCDLSGVR